MYIYSLFLSLSVAIARYNAYYGQGSGAIHLDNIRCIGNEASILDCPASRDTGTDGHFEDAGVTCYPADGKNTHAHVLYMYIMC